MNIQSRNVRKSTSNHLGLCEMVSIVTKGQQLGKKQKMKHFNESDEDGKDEDETSEFSSSKVFHKKSFWKLLYIYIEVIVRFKGILFSKKPNANFDKEKVVLNSQIAAKTKELIAETSSDEIEAKPVCEIESTTQSKGGAVSFCNFEHETKQRCTNQGHDINLEQFSNHKQEVL